MAQKIIVDTDPGVDDVLAILLSLASPEVSVALISIVFGNTHAPVAHKNLLKIYHALAKEIMEHPEASKRYELKEKTILALGEDGPIGGEKATAAYFHGPDGLSNISVTHPQFTPPERGVTDPHDHLEISDKPAYENILNILKQEDAGTVSIVALGPSKPPPSPLLLVLPDISTRTSLLLSAPATKSKSPSCALTPVTNLAHALRADPTTFSRVKSVIWMGGALDHPGNTSPTAEFNCFADPYAAQAILDAVNAGAFHMILAPLDITTPHQIPFDDLIHPSYPDNPDPSLTPLKHLTSAMLGRVRGLQASFGLPDAMEMHDPVAVWYAIAHAHLPAGKNAEEWVIRGRQFKVERIGELTRGMCVVDRRGGEGAGGTRTEDKELADNHIPGEGKRDRDGSEVKQAKNEAKIITNTPGSEALRKLLLKRVFGTEV